MDMVLTESKMIDTLVQSLKTKKDTYDFIGIKDVLLEVIASEYPELAASIRTTSHLDAQGNVVAMASAFCGFDAEQAKMFKMAMSNLHLSDILMKPFGDDQSF
jgi:hypothetical protein